MNWIGIFAGCAAPGIFLLAGDAPSADKYCATPTYWWQYRNNNNLPDVAGVKMVATQLLPESAFYRCTFQCQVRDRPLTMKPPLVQREHDRERWAKRFSHQESERRELVTIQVSAPDRTQHLKSRSSFSTARSPSSAHRRRLSATDNALRIAEVARSLVPYRAAEELGGVAPVPAVNKTF